MFLKETQITLDINIYNNSKKTKFKLIYNSVTSSVSTFYFVLPLSTVDISYYTKFVVDAIIEFKPSQFTGTQS